MNWSHILNLHAHAVLMTIHLLIFIKFWCSWVFAFFWKFLGSRTMKLCVWSKYCLASFEIVFGASINQSGSAKASFRSDVVLANVFNITQLPFLHLINIYFIPFSFDYFFLLCELRKLITHSFFIQIECNFLHYSHDNV